MIRDLSLALLIAVAFGGCGAASGRGEAVAGESTTAATLVGRASPAPPEAEASDHVETDNDLPYDASLGLDGPFTGPANNGLIGLSLACMGLFDDEGRDRFRSDAERAEGEDTDAPLALRWLAEQQAQDGGWDDRGGAGAETSDDPGLTGRVLLGFLAAGYTNRGRHPFARSVSLGLRFLKNRQDEDGWFVEAHPSGAAHDLRVHLPATSALVEAYAQTGSPIFKAAAIRGIDALAGACATRDRDLDDPAIAYEGLLALASAARTNRKRAERDKPPVFAVDAERFEVLVGRARLPDHPGALDLALAILAVETLAGKEGVARRQDLAAWAADRVYDVPYWDASGRAPAPWAWSLLHSAVELARPEGAPRRLEALRRTLFAHQVTAAWDPPHAGSWDPATLPGCFEGRVRLTTDCLAALWRIR